MFKVLSKVPFVGEAVAFVTNNARLVLEYVLIALVIAGGALTIAAHYRVKELEESNTALTSRVATMEVVDATQNKTIADLQDLRQKDAEVMAGLVNDYAKLSKSDVSARKKLLDLEKQNARVRDYLSQPVPPELVCMLNNSCTPATGGASGQGKAASQPSGDVQKARPPRDPKQP